MAKFEIVSFCNRMKLNICILVIRIMICIYVLLYCLEYGRTCKAFIKQHCTINGSKHQCHFIGIYFFHKGKHFSQFVTQHLVDMCEKVFFALCIVFYATTHAKSVMESKMYMHICLII